AGSRAAAAHRVDASALSRARPSACAARRAALGLVLLVILLVARALLSGALERVGLVGVLELRFLLDHAAVRVAPAVAHLGRLGIGPPRVGVGDARRIERDQAIGLVDVADPDVGAKARLLAEPLREALPLRG